MPAVKSVKTFPAVGTKTVSAERGIVSTVFAVTGNQDRQDDVIRPGAFQETLQTSRLAPVVYAHKWDDLNSVLGKTLGWRELMPGDPALPEPLLSQGLGGVKATVQFEMDTQSGRDAFTHVKNGNLVEWSWAFDIPEGGSSLDSKGVRHINKVGAIFEVSLVLIGANPATVTMDAKARASSASSTEAALVAAQWMLGGRKSRTKTPQPLVARINRILSGQK